MRLDKFGLRIRPERDFELVNPESDPRYREVWTEYYKVMGRRGVSPDDARTHVRQSTTLIGAMLLHGDGDAMLCGTFGRHKDHLRHVRNVIGLERGASLFAAMNMPLLPKQTLFIADTYVNEDPSAEQSRTSPSWRRRKCCALVSRRRSRCCRTRTSVPTIRPPR